MKGKKKHLTPMEQITAGYEKFIKGKKVNSNGKQIFDSVLKKATTKKQPAAK